MNYTEELEATRKAVDAVSERLDRLQREALSIVDLSPLVDALKTHAEVLQSVGIQLVYTRPKGADGLLLFTRRGKQITRKVWVSEAYQIPSAMNAVIILDAGLLAEQMGYTNCKEV